MRNGVYLLLGLIVIIRCNGIKGQIPYCRYDNEKTKLEAKCYHKADIEAYNTSSYIPMTKLSTGISSLTLQTTAPNAKWYIDSFDYFTRFENLKTLLIYGPVTFANGLLSNKFRENFLNIPTLKTLVLYNNKFNSNDHMWELPLGLKNLTIKANDYTDFDLKRNPHLEAIYFHRTPLTTLPQLTNPPPPLHFADFRQNSLLELKVDNLASICSASELALDADNLQKPGQHCECIRMKRWINEILKQSEEQFFNKTLDCASSDGQNCQNFTLEKAIQKREECIQKMVPKYEEGEIFSDAGQSYGKTFIILGTIIAILTAVSLLALVAYRYFINVSPDTAAGEVERKLEDDTTAIPDEQEPEDEEILIEPHDYIDYSRIDETPVVNE